MANTTIKLDLEIDLSKVKKEGQALGNIFQRSLNKSTRAKALDSLERQINKVRNQMHSIQSDLVKVLNTPIRSQAFDDAIKDARKFKEAMDAYRQANPQKANWSNRDILASMRVMKNSNPLVNSSKFGVFDAKQAIAELDKIQNKINDLVKTGKAFKIDDDAVKRLTDELGVSKEKLQELLQSFSQLSYSDGNWIQNAVQPMANFNSEVQATANTLGQAFGPYVQAAVFGLTALVEVTKLEIQALAKLSEAAISAFKPLVSLAELAGKAIGKMFDSIKKHNETTMKNLWRNVLRYGIGVRSMYFLIRKIRNEIGDAINQLSKQIPEVNAKMSEFKTAVNGLKGALASAFQPILTSILPILTKLINAVAKAISVVGQFIALLTGQKFVYAATATQVDYAKSLDKTGKAADKAKKKDIVEKLSDFAERNPNVQKAAKNKSPFAPKRVKSKKKLEGYLSPIDEINKYQSEKDSDKDKGGGGDDVPYKLEKMPIDDWIKDLWDKIKKAWQTADFFELGKMLGDKLAKALASIPWDKIKNVARKLGKSLATLLNGIMSGEWDGKSLGYWIGHTLAQAINTGFEFLNQFAKNFDWKKLGTTIVDALKGLFENLDWNLITETFGEVGLGLGKTIAEIFNHPEVFAEAGEALAKLVNALVDMIYNFFNQQDGKKIGAAIASFINGAIETFDAKDFAHMCNVIMTTLLDSLISAVGNTKWDEIGTKIAEMINTIDFKGIFSKYKDLANNIVDAILDMLESFLNTLTPQKIEEIGTSIANAINGLNFQPERFGTIVNNLLNALLDIAVTAVDAIEWDKIADAIATFLGQIQWGSIIAKAIHIKTEMSKGLKELIEGAAEGAMGTVGKIGVNIIEGLWWGIKNAFLALLGPSVGLFRTWIDAVADVFGIHSPSTVFMEFGEMIVQGLIDGIKALLNSVIQIWNNLKAEVERIFTELKDAVIGIAQNIKTTVSNWFTKLKDAVVGPDGIIPKFKTTITELFEGARTAVEAKVQALKTNVSNIFTKLKNAVVGENGIVTRMKDALKKAASTIKENWTKVFTGLQTTVLGIFDKMWAGIKKVINAILGGVEKMANGVINGLNKAIGAINNLQFDVPGWVPIVGGEKLGFDIPTLNNVTIPKLAQGAVIPPNKEFLATLGDQKSGTNIETPLSTMIEAFNIALRNSNVGGVKQINFLLPDRRTLAQYTIAGGRIIQTSTGKNPFELA